MTRSSCPDIGDWQALLANESSGDEPADLVEHLENCNDCQLTLEGLGGDRSVWSCIADGLGESARQEPALRELVHSLKLEEPEPEEDFPYLRPSEKPGLLGLLRPYEVQEVIGRGGTAVVFKAVDPALGRVVAIKVLAAAVACSAAARRRFTREAQAAAAVCHDHIVTVHGVSEEAGLPYLVMQYIPGESVQARLDRTGPLEVIEIVRIGLQTASALAAAHAQGLIHRDIKPANLLLEDGLARVKITDFGLARMTDDAALTHNSELAGTPEYMAPEQARGEGVDHRADLFSLGSVLYAISSGLPPFRGSTALAVLRKVSDQTPIPIRELNPEIPAWVDLLVTRLLAKNPADRFQSAGEVASLLEGYLAHLRQPTTVRAPVLPPLPPGARPRPPAPRVRKRFAFRSWLALFLCLAAIQSGVAYWFAGAAGTDGPAAPQWKARFHQDFRAADLKHPSLQVTGKTPVRYEADGVRVTMPANSEKAMTTGLATSFKLRGDFEITFAYEVVNADRPKTGTYGPGVSIYAAINTDTQDAVSLGRRVMPNGKVVFMSDRMKPVEGKPPTHDVKQRPSTKATGKLRVRRAGTRVTFFVSDGDQSDFFKIGESDIGTGDISWMQIGGDVGDTEAAVDVRLLELTIGADELPGLTKLSPGPTPPGNASAGLGKRAQPEESSWLMTGLIVGGAIAGASGIAAVLHVRRRRSRKATISAEPVVQDKPVESEENTSIQTTPVAASPAVRETPPRTEVPAGQVSVRCSKCGKMLKGRPELAGKRVKCPSCGEPLLVPRPQVAEAGGAS
jgi:serine/threonine protein kinase